MNHEPECPNRILWQPPEYVNDDCAYCIVLKRAYQRGREDAADDLVSMQDTAFRSRAWLPRGTAIAVARGDGGQE